MPELVLSNSNSPSHVDCVSVLANKAIRPGTVVMDVGAGDGAWARVALTTVPGIEVHCFESDPSKYRQLLVNLAPQISTGQVVPHNATVGWANPDGGVSWNSLPQYAASAGLGRLPFVRLGTGVPITAALAGCENLIQRGHIEFILAPANAEQEASLVALLLPHRYELFRHPAMGDHVLCASDRFRSTIRNEQPQPVDVLQLCQEFGITPKGVIVSGHAGITAVHGKAMEQNGSAELNVTEAPASSAVFLLPGQTAPSAPARRVEVPAKTIDQIVQDTGHNAADFNLLNLNIAGAELSILKGATRVLPNVHAVLATVNYGKPQAGRPTIEELDAYLESQGFDRAATASPFDPDSAEAFYVRRRPAPVPQQSRSDFLYDARNQIVGGWLSLSSATIREAWEGPTGHAHRHLVENGICQLPIASDEDRRVLELLEKSLQTATKDRRLQVLLALMMYVPVDQIAVSTDGIPGWLKKSLPGLGTAQVAIAA